MRAEYKVVISRDYHYHRAQLYKLSSIFWLKFWWEVAGVEGSFDGCLEKANQWQTDYSIPNLRYVITAEPESRT